MAVAFSEKDQLLNFSNLVPKRARIDLEKFTTMSHFWDYMDSKFRDEDKLMTDRIAYLRNYKHPKEGQVPRR